MIRTMVTDADILATRQIMLQLRPEIPPRSPPLPLRNRQHPPAHANGELITIARRADAQQRRPAHLHALFGAIVDFGPAEVAMLDDIRGQIPVGAAGGGVLEETGIVGEHTNAEIIRRIL